MAGWKSWSPRQKKMYVIFVSLLFTVLLVFGIWYQTEKNAYKQAKQEEQQSLDKALTALCGKGNSLKTLACRDAMREDYEKNKK